MPINNQPGPGVPVLPPEERARRVDLVRKAYEDHPHKAQLVHLAETDDKALACIWKAVNALDKFNEDFNRLSDEYDVALNTMSRDASDANRQAWVAAKMARTALKAENDARIDAVEALLVREGIARGSEVAPAAEAPESEGNGRASTSQALSAEQLVEVLQEVVQGTALPSHRHPSGQCGVHGRGPRCLGGYRFGCSR